MEGIDVSSNDKLKLGRKTADDGRHTALKRRAEAAAEAGDYDQAERLYQQAAALAPQEADPQVGLGTIYLHTGRLAKAEGAFRLARRLQPTCAEAHGGLAMIHQHRKEYPAAFNMYLKCLELDTDNLVALLGLFQASCQMGTFRMITQYLERYLQVHPDDTPVLFCLATLYARDGKFDQARDAAARVLELEPTKAEAAHLLAAVEERLAARPKMAANA